jgi:hypothetical protein
MIRVSLDASSANTMNWADSVIKTAKQKDLVVFALGDGVLEDNWRTGYRGHVVRAISDEYIYIAGT